MGVLRVQVKSWCRRFGAKGGNMVNYAACLLVLRWIIEILHDPKYPWE